jgi:hypothetical protein
LQHEQADTHKYDKTKDCRTEQRANPLERDWSAVLQSVNPPQVSRCAGLRNPGLDRCLAGGFSTDG